MRIIRVFPNRTSYAPDDNMVFIGMPPFIIPEHNEVHVLMFYEKRPTWTF